MILFLKRPNPVKRTCLFSPCIFFFPFSTVFVQISPLASPQLVSGGIAVSIMLVYLGLELCSLHLGAAHVVWFEDKGFFSFFFLFIFPCRFFFLGQCSIVSNIYQSKIIQCLSIQRGCMSLCSMSPCFQYLPCLCAPANSQ